MIDPSSGHPIRSYLVIICLVLGLGLGSATQSQILYGADESSEELRILDPIDGVVLSVIGDLTPTSGGISMSRGLAMSPGGVLYTVYERISPTEFVLGTVDPATAEITPIGVTDRLRGLVFDSAGVLWATTGGNGSPAHSLVTVDPTTGLTVTQNMTLSTIRNKLAYRAVSDELFLLGYDSMSASWQLDRFSPSDPATLTAVSLTGESLSDSMAQPPMVHDPDLDLILTNQSGDWFTITPGGLVTLVSPSSIDNYGGLSFDPKGLNPVLFRDGFESGDAMAWSSVVPAP